METQQYFVLANSPANLTKPVKKKKKERKKVVVIKTKIPFPKKTKYFNLRAKITKDTKNANVLITPGQLQIDDKLTECNSLYLKKINKEKQ